MTVDSNHVAELETKISGLEGDLRSAEKAIKKLEGELAELLDKFREHGHIGDGLGSCWDGT